MTTLKLILDVIPEDHRASKSDLHQSVDSRLNVLRNLRGTLGHTRRILHVTGKFFQQDGSLKLSSHVVSEFRVPDKRAVYLAATLDDISSMYRLIFAPSQVVTRILVGDVQDEQSQ